MYLLAGKMMGMSKWTEDLCLTPEGLSAKCIGVSRISGEHLQAHWSSGFKNV